MSIAWARLWAKDEEPQKRDLLLQARCEKLARRNRMAFPGKVRVIHPAHGEIVVPGASPFAAILCAAEIWGCDWSEIRDARVERLEPEGIKKDPPGQGQVEENTTKR